MDNKEDKAVLIELAKRVKALRNEKGLTQIECFNDTGINFGRIERGVRNISFTTLLKICKYFEIPAKDFFDKSF